MAPTRYLSEGIKSEVGGPKAKISKNMHDFKGFQ